MSGSTAMGSARIVNAMSVDVEDWFHVENYKGLIPRADWDRLPRRVEENTALLLDLFAAAGVRATFFTLGLVARQHPALVRRIVAEGHELASHGHGHERVAAIGPRAFREDLQEAAKALSDCAGVPVAGYRAPTFSIGPATPWAHEILAELGFRYSSSVFPGRHEGKGAPGIPLDPYRTAGGRLLEIPMTALRPALLRGRALPVSGGGWFRAAPHGAFTAALRHVNRAERRRAVFYIHPWEVDPDQPRVPGMPPLKRMKHFLGLSGTAGRIARLLQDFAWDRMDRVFAPELAGATLPAPGGDGGLRAAA